MAIIDDVKLVLRLQNDLYDVEVETLISAAKHFLINSGIPENYVNDDNNKEITNLINIYCKTFFGLHPQNQPPTLPDFYVDLVAQLKLKHEAVPENEN